MKAFLLFCLAVFASTGVDAVAIRANRNRRFAHQISARNAMSIYPENMKVDPLSESMDSHTESMETSDSEDSISMAVA
jgi:hypothetical protein